MATLTWAQPYLEHRLNLDLATPADQPRRQRHRTSPFYFSISKRQVKLKLLPWRRDCTFLRTRVSVSEEIRGGRIGGATTKNNVVFLYRLITCFMEPKITHTRSIPWLGESLPNAVHRSPATEQKKPQIRRLEIAKERLRTIHDCHTRP